MAGIFSLLDHKVGEFPSRRSLPAPAVRICGEFMAADERRLTQIETKKFYRR
jgi:hypothetical protein